jgi:hypothetical protein
VSIQEEANGKGTFVNSHCFLLKLNVIIGLLSYTILEKVHITPFNFGLCQNNPQTNIWFNLLSQTI